MTDSVSARTKLGDCTLEILDRSTKNVPNNLKQRLFRHRFNRSDFSELQRQILPRKATFNVVNICNANCVFCAYQYRSDTNAIMTNDLFDRITKEYASFHPDSFISLTPTVGDPLIDPEIFEKVRIAKKNGIKRVQFYTNAILLKRRLKDLLDAPLDNLEVSLGDFDEEEYKILYRVDKYKVVLEGISLLLQELKRRRSTLRVDIQLRHRRKFDVILQSPDFLSKIQPHLTEYTTISNTECFDTWMGMIKPDDLPSGMKLASDAKNSHDLPCSRSFDVQFLHNGEVRICGCRFKTTVFDELVIGNIKEKSLEDIWFSEKAFSFRNDFFDKKYFPACENCSFYGPIGYKRFYMRDLATANRLKINSQQDTRESINDWEARRPSMHQSVETGTREVRGGRSE